MDGSSHQDGRQPAGVTMFDKTQKAHSATTSGVLGPGAGARRTPHPGRGWRLLETGESVRMSDQFHDLLAVPPAWRPVPLDLLGLRFVIGRYPYCRRPSGARGFRGQPNPAEAQAT